MCLCMLAYRQYESMEAKIKRDIKILEKAGGIIEINREARILFDLYSTNEWSFLYESDLKDCPSISSLGNAYTIHPKPVEISYTTMTQMHSSMVLPPHINVRRGSHSDAISIFIFKPDEVVKLNNDSTFVGATSNIFFLR